MTGSDALERPVYPIECGKTSKTPAAGQVFRYLYFLLIWVMPEVPAISLGTQRNTANMTFSAPDDAVAKE
ncbi:hypothetical protein CI238_13362 [Colletotrichum incanum]|uniref:Uncharacterized protein n=1 Tax=Colletotrichum incanum TaxID=1573173 RepID=A0A162PBN5_COLIC|nr:hypothetical protein CI238_13362 [Colletotrichum incanum]